MANLYVRKVLPNLFSLEVGRIGVLLVLDFSSVFGLAVLHLAVVACVWCRIVPLTRWLLGLKITTVI